MSSASADLSNPSMDPNRIVTHQQSSQHHYNPQQHYHYGHPQQHNQMFDQYYQQSQLPGGLGAPLAHDSSISHHSSAPSGNPGHNVTTPPATDEPKSAGQDATPSSPNSNKGAYLNRRRTRATPEQLAILEDTFLKNSSPNSRVREMLAERLDMTERSVQIWFQNRRAKVKMMQKRFGGIPRGAGGYRPPLMMGAYPGDITGMQPHPLKRNHSFGGFGSGSDMVHGDMSMLPHGGFSPFPESSPYLSEEGGLFSSPMTQGRNERFGSGSWSDLGNTLPCNMLAIGSWQRMPVKSDDLSCTFCPETRQMSWLIGENLTKFQIIFPYTAISHLELVVGALAFARLTITLNAPPSFYIQSNPIGGAPQVIDANWVPCSDFTENQQATQCLKHVIKGNAQALQMQVRKLLQHSPELVNISSLHSNPSQQPSNRRSSVGHNMPGMGSVPDVGGVRRMHYGVGMAPESSLGPAPIETATEDSIARSRSYSLPVVPQANNPIGMSHPNNPNNANNLSFDGSMSNFSNPMVDNSSFNPGFLQRGMSMAGSTAQHPFSGLPDLAEESVPTSSIYYQDNVVATPPTNINASQEPSASQPPTAS